MKSTLKVSMLTLVFAIFVFANVGCAADTSTSKKAPAIGDIMPGFNLKDLESNVHTLDQYKGKVIVIEMCSQLCPYSRGADPHLVELSKKYADKDVVFIGIDSHHSTTVEEIKKYAEETGKSYTILKDEGNKYADEIGAKVTPEVYVIDKEGKLAYHGAFDNREKPDTKGSKTYVDDAIAAVLEGKKPEPATVKAWGCTIKRK